MIPEKCLKISDALDYETHLNQYNVIHLDIMNFIRGGEGTQRILPRLNSEVIGELKEQFKGILADDEDYLPHALSVIHDKEGVSFVVIIDEWDAVFREYKYDTKAQEDYIDFLRGLFKGELPKGYIRLAYLTGILPIKK